MRAPCTTPHHHQSRIERSCRSCFLRFTAVTGGWNENRTTSTSPTAHTSKRYRRHMGHGHTDRQIHPRCVLGTVHCTQRAAVRTPPKKSRRRRPPAEYAPARYALCPWRPALCPRLRRPRTSRRPPAYTSLPADWNIAIAAARCVCSPSLLTPTGPLGLPGVFPLRSSDFFGPPCEVAARSRRGHGEVAARSRRGRGVPEGGRGGVGAGARASGSSASSPSFEVPSKTSRACETSW